MKNKKSVLITIVTAVFLLNYVSPFVQATEFYPQPPSQETLDRLKQLGEENLKKYGPGPSTTSQVTSKVTPKGSPTPSFTSQPTATPTAKASNSLQTGNSNVLQKAWHSITNFFTRFWSKRISVFTQQINPQPIKNPPITDTSTTISPSGTAAPTKKSAPSSTTALQNKPLLPSATPIVKNVATRPTSTIIWSTRKLTWSDFVGKPNSNDPERAKIAVRISAQSQLGEQCSTNECKVTITGFQINAQMDTTQSYVIPGSETAERLAHEQLHFDLTEAYARILRSALNPYIGRSETAQGADINAAFEAAASRLDALVNPIVVQYQNELHQQQTAYDNETNHSLNEGAQAAWAAKISAMLN